MPAVSRAADGELALVLHTHMPYVEGFGTWPFGEEWLWEAIATSYLPLLGVLERAGGADHALADAGAVRPARGARGAGSASWPSCATCAHGVAPARRRRPARGGADDLAAELERVAAATTRGAAERFEAIGGDLLGGAAPRTPRGPRAATHAVLPLLATDAGVRLQLATGIEAHRRASATLARRLLAAGVRARAVARPAARGGGRARHLRRPDRRPRPRRAPRTCARCAATAGPVLVPDRPRDDRAGLERPTATRRTATYRDYHHRTSTTTGRGPTTARAYDRERALAHRPASTPRTSCAPRARARRRGGGLLRAARSTPSCSATGGTRGRGGSTRVLDEAARAGPGAGAARRRARAPRAGGRAARAAGDDLGPAARPRRRGRARGSPNWPGARATPSCACSRPARPAGPRALRELLALQASDWAFLVTRELAGPYARERADAPSLPRLRAALRLGSRRSPTSATSRRALEATGLLEP